MSVEKNMNTRIQHKHDTEANWNKALNFIPKAGEIIIYDIDEHYNYSRFKIGDGVRTINNLEFSQTDTSAIIDVTQLPTEDIQEDCFYRLLTGSLVINQTVQNAYTIHCVDVLPETGEPATNMDNTAGNVYYDISAGDVYGYIDDILSAGLSIPVGWYDATTLLGAMGLSYAGIITDIEDDPRDGQFRLLLQYVNYSHKDGIWTSMKTIGWAGTGSRAEIFNHLSNVASGHYSHAEGYSSHAEGDCSHAEGNSSHAEGDSSHAEGSSSHAKGYFSHAEGNSSYAEGRGSHAEGYFSHAEGHYSHAEGCGSHAVGYSQHVQGEYNLVDPEYSPGISEFRAKYAHIVGNGTSEGTRSNAHTLDWDGNAWFAGDVYVGGTGQDDENAERLAKMSDIPSIEGFATESYVDSAVASLVNAAPDTLDTLNELAAALGDDANFATTVTNQISGKLDVSELPTAVNDALAQAKASGEFDGTNGKDGTSVTHSWNGTTLTITSASGTSSVDLKGEKGDAGSVGKDGYSPVRGTDYWTEADQEAIVQQVITALGTPVFGRVEDGNKIITTGNLASGTYEYWYEDKDGKQVLIGTLEHDADAPNYTNQIPISTGTDGNVFNGTGYQTASRISSSSGVAANVSNANATYPSFTTGFIPVKKGDVIRLQNCWMDTKSYDDATSPYGHRTWALLVAFYDGLNTTVKASRAWTDFPTNTDVITATIGSDGRITQFVVNVSNPYMRLNLASADPSDAILTINEEIV